MTLVLDDALADLEKTVAQALANEGARPANWVHSGGGVDHDVLIVGGGQSGLALAFALRRSGVTRISIIEAQPAGQAGIWDRTARMHTLRTGKTLTGPDLGFLPLSFPSWFDAREGAGAFAAIVRIGRQDWADYLRWFEKQAGIAVRHETRLTRLEPVGEHFRVHTEQGGSARVEVARKVVLATGLLGIGKASVPSILTENLPSSSYRHSSQAIDFAALRGRDVGVIGTGASAFDSAAVALESGARSAHMFCRKPAIPILQVNQPRNYPGAADYFPDLPDAIRWTLFNRVSRGGTPPPADSVGRVLGFDNFHIHLGTQFGTVGVEDGRIAASWDGGGIALDFIVAATGFAQDPRLAAPLADFSDRIALWQDKHDPPADEANAGLATYPYLGGQFEFTEKQPGSAPFLKNLHCYTAAAAVSFGRLIGDVPSMSWGIGRLAPALSRDLFVQDYESHLPRMLAISTSHEFPANLYAPRVWQGA
jgi:cation diffusion facilitator CzcD-associated flavoprotein CzcO